MCKKQGYLHHLNTADIVTFFRIAGTILLVFLQPLSASFFLLYALTGLTDVLDGWIARKTKTASDFGATLDSIADLLFYAVILFLMISLLWRMLPRGIWFAVISIVIVRISAYLVAAMKYRRFASLHTYLNKLTGMAVFLVPFSLVTYYMDVYCWIVCLIALAASVEELAIHIHSRHYRPNIKSIFSIRKENCFDS